jgi:hypothetical protein
MKWQNAKAAPMGQRESNWRWEDNYPDFPGKTIFSLILQVELSPNFIYVRAKNAAKYPLPFALMGSADLRVFFVKIEKMQKVEDAKRIEGCQLNSEIDLKETSNGVGRKEFSRIL